MVSANAQLTHALAYVRFAAGGFARPRTGTSRRGNRRPALLLRLPPTWSARVGLVIAVLAELSFLSMVIAPLQFLIPIGCFGSLRWTVIAAFRLPQTRHIQGERA